MSVKMALSERDRYLNKARHELDQRVLEWLKGFDLSTAEELHSLTQVLLGLVSGTLKHVVREEREGRTWDADVNETKPKEAVGVTPLTGPLRSGDTVWDGILLHLGSEPHMCQPPRVGTQPPSMITRSLLPVGSVWKCNCGVIWLVTSNMTWHRETTHERNLRITRWRRGSLGD
jgi:hypothetical protein